MPVVGYTYSTSTGTGTGPKYKDRLHINTKWKRSLSYDREWYTWYAYNSINLKGFDNLHFYFCNHDFYVPAQLVHRFYPQQSSGQAVVTGVVPSPPRWPCRYQASN